MRSFEYKETPNALNRPSTTLTGLRNEDRKGNGLPQMKVSNSLTALNQNQAQIRPRSTLQ